MENIKMTVKQTAGRDQLGTFAPTFARINDDVLFGEVWSRTEALGLRERSIVTVVSLVSQGLVDASLEYHLTSAKKNGVTQTEIAEILTQTGFYAGWPKAWAAFRMAKNVWNEEGEALSARRRARAPSALDALSARRSQHGLCPVLQRPQLARTALHDARRRRLERHVRARLPQQLARACRQNGRPPDPRLRGRPPAGIRRRAKRRRLSTGDVVTIPAGVKHWHGAARDSWFSHLAIEVPGTETSNQWLEPVSDADYPNA